MWCHFLFFKHIFFYSSYLSPADNFLYFFLVRSGLASLMALCLCLAATAQPRYGCKCLPLHSPANPGALSASSPRALRSSLISSLLELASHTKVASVRPQPLLPVHPHPAFVAWPTNPCMVNLWAAGNSIAMISTCSRSSFCSGAHLRTRVANDDEDPREQMFVS